MANLNEMKGGRGFGPPFQRFIDAIEDVAMLDFFNIFRMACVFSRSSYLSYLIVATAAPLVFLAVNVSSLYVLKSRPSIGERRPFGQAMTDERMARDWFLIAIMKYTVG